MDSNNSSLNQPKINIIYSRDLLGEGPLWDSNKNKLHWVDFEGKLIHTYDDQTKEIKHTQTEDHPTALAVKKSGGLLFTCGFKGIAQIDESFQKVELLENIFNPVKGNETKLRFNDGKCDRQGRYYVGTIDFSQAGKQVASFYRLDDLKQTQMSEIIDKWIICNGPVWSLDNSKFYFADSPTQQSFVYDFDYNKGTVSNQKQFAKLEEGYFDGATIDQEGYIWWAIYAGSCIKRYSPEGKLERTVKLECEKPTSCMFGGKDLNQLFVTSVSYQPSAPQCGPELPHPNGCLFELKFEKENIKGIPEPYFNG